MPCTDIVQREYFELVKVVADFDQRLFLVKGWGVTFGLATLLVGAQSRKVAALFVAAISALGFWLVEGAVKGHQMRYYPRMEAIEIACKATGGPRIHQSWENAVPPLFGEQSVAAEDTAPRGLGTSYYLRWFFPAVALPHVLTMLAALVLAWRVSRRLPPNDAEA